MKCTLCSSDKIMPNLRIRDLYDLHQGGDLEVVIPRNPNAIVFKNLHREALRATVCGNCGNVSITVDNAKALWETYTQSN